MDYIWEEDEDIIKGFYLHGKEEERERTPLQGLTTYSKGTELLKKVHTNCSKLCKFI